MSAVACLVAAAVAAAGFSPVDLRKHVTTGFSDSVANDYMGGWFDEGSNDLRTVPVGRRMFAGVPFDVIDPDQNGGASCIALKSVNRPYFPPKVTGIPVGAAGVDVLHFLHACGWGDMKLEGSALLRYRLNYADGSSVDIPAVYNRDIGNWWAPQDISNAALAWAGYNPVGRLVGLWRFAAANPQPDREIRTIDIISEETTGIAGVVAITLQRGTEKPKRCGKAVKLRVAKDSKEYVSIPEDVTTVKGVASEAEMRLRRALEKTRQRRDEYRMANELFAYGLGRKLKPARYAQVGAAEPAKVQLAASKPSSFPVRAVFGSIPAAGQLFVESVCEALDGRVVVPMYAAQFYRVLDEGKCRADGWTVCPVAWFGSDLTGTAKRHGIVAAILRKGDVCETWTDYESLKHLFVVWKDSFNRRCTGADPRQPDKSRAADSLVRFLEANRGTDGVFVQISDDPARALADAQRELAFESNAWVRLSAEIAATERPQKRSHVTVRDGMFVKNGRPKVLWGTEVSGYKGQGGNDITSALAPNYVRAAASLFNFDYAVYTLFPILESYRGVVNPKWEQFSRAGYDPDEMLCRASREYAHQSWAMEMNSVFFTYNTYMRDIQDFREKNGDNCSVLACPEEPDTWEAMEQLYGRMIADTVGAGANVRFVELDNESLYSSHSPSNCVAFRTWLARRYGSVDALNRRWGKTLTGFDAIEPPKLEAKTALRDGLPPTIDWIKFQQDRYTEVIARKKAMIARLMGTNEVYYTIQPFATVSGGDHRHSYAMRGCCYEAVADLVDVLSSERLFTPFQDVQSPEQMPVAVGNTGYIFSALLASIGEKRAQPVVNTEGAMVKYGGKKTADEYRLAVWSHIMHGDQAIVPTYWCYFPAADSVVHPANNEMNVLPAMCEIGKSLERCGELVAPPRRIRGETAVFISFESMCDVRRPFSPEPEFYAGTFSRRALELVTSRQVLDGKLSRYRALLLTSAHLVDPQAFAKIREWVRAGGVALASPETFLGDEYGAPLEEGGAFFPFARDFGFLSAPVTAARPSATAAVKVASYGKGKVCQFVETPTAARLLAAWKGILDESGISAEVEVKGEGTEHFVEAQIVERGEKGFILYLANFLSKPVSVTVPATGRLVRGGYRMVSLLDGSEVRTAAGKDVWTGQGDELSLCLPARGCAVIHFKPKN